MPLLMIPGEVSGDPLHGLPEVKSPTGLRHHAAPHDSRRSKLRPVTRPPRDEVAYCLSGVHLPRRVTAADNTMLGEDFGRVFAWNYM
jgi:hypothetical protein